MLDAFWPLFFLGLGAYGFLRTGSPVIRIWSGAAFVAGVLLVLDLFHVVRVTMATLWPLALIAAGAVLLVARMALDGPHRPAHLASNQRLAAHGLTRLNEVAVFSGVKRRIESQNFEGGELSSVFGAIEIDLRRAGISNDGKVAVLEANAAFGGVELRIPETWRLSMQGVAVFGSYEDKTIPPRPEPGVETPTLVIKGGTAFGAVIVRN